MSIQWTALAAVICIHHCSYRNWLAFRPINFLIFAEQLMREGEYFRAITEYRRFLFYYPDDPRRAMAHFSIGLAFYRGESYVEALQTFQEVD
jgi:tetratricopeptide (TPR) repeat protein